MFIAYPSSPLFLRSLCLALFLDFVDCSILFVFFSDFAKNNSIGDCFSYFLKTKINIFTFVLGILRALLHGCCRVLKICIYMFFIVDWFIPIPIPISGLFVIHGGHFA